jgi:hypothetical protein
MLDKLIAAIDAEVKRHNDSIGDEDAFDLLDSEEYGNAIGYLEGLSFARSLLVSEKENS